MNKLIRAIIGNGAGVTAAQLISFASMMMVARLYSPSEIGYLGLFTALIAVLGPIGTLSYPNAICFARSNGHAMALAALGLRGALVLALLVGLTGVFISAFRNDAIAQGAVLGFGIFASASMVITTQWSFRARLIRLRSTVLVIVATIVALARIVLGWQSPSAIALVGSAIFGFILTSVLLLVFGLRVRRPMLATALRIPLRHCARLYNAFPRYAMPHALVRYATLAAPTLALGAVVGPAMAGQYMLAASVVSAPLLMVADAVGDAVTRPLAQLAEGDRSEAFRFACQLSGILALLVVPALLLFLFVPRWVMGTAFGPGWDVSAEFVRFLVLWTGAMLITRPLMCLIPAFGMQKLLLRNELWFSALRLAGLFIGLLALNSPVLAVAGFALPGVLLSLLNALLVLQGVDCEDGAK